MESNHSACYDHPPARGIYNLIYYTVMKVSDFKATIQPEANSVLFGQDTEQVKLMHITQYLTA